MPEATGIRDGDTTAAAPSSTETIYHVRIIQAWQMGEKLPTTTPKEKAQFSFFGLELELMGFQTGRSNPQVPVSSSLHFSKSVAIGSALDKSLQLSSITGPFQIRVAGKMASSSPHAPDSDKLVLQKFIAVQPGNLLLEINSVRFLQACSTGKDVRKSLLRALTKVSMAKPFEFTFQRHNHAQAAARIVPFAMRADVQTAQVAQYKKMQEQEVQLSEVVKRKKQFITQQMDYELEHYLFDHIGMELFHLHEEIMSNGQWQAYEFEQALWYYHTGTSRLYAEHPMRNSEKTRQLIGTAQLKTRFAVQKLQRATRICLRQKKIADAAVDHLLFDKIWIDVWQQTWTKIWTDQFLSLHTRLLGASPNQKSTLTLEQEVERLWTGWINRNVQPPRARDETPATSVVPSKGPDLADVVKNGIPPSALRQKDAEPTVIADNKQQVNDNSVDNPLTVDHALQTIPGPDEPEVIPAPPAESKCDGAQSSSAAEDEEKLPPQENKLSGLYADDDDDSLQWRGYLTLLKSNLKQNKSSPPKKHRVQAKKPTLRVRNDAVATNLNSHNEAYDEYDRGYEVNYLPRAAQNTTSGYPNSTHLNDNMTSSTRVGNSIAPPKHGDLAPFMLSIPQHSAYNRDHVYSSLSHPVAPTPFDSLKVRFNRSSPSLFYSHLTYLAYVPTLLLLKQTEARSFPVPMVMKHVDSFEDVDSWHRSGSFRAFHSFFARNLDDPGDANDFRIHEHTVAETHAVEHWSKRSVVVNQQKHEHFHPQPHAQVLLRAQPSNAIDIMPSDVAFSQPSKAFTASEMKILLRQDRFAYQSKTPAPSAKSSTKLPYIVRKKKNGQP